jgi:hypothetical protein
MCYSRHVAPCSGWLRAVSYGNTFAFLYIAAVIYFVFNVRYWKIWLATAAMRVTMLGVSCVVYCPAATLIAQLYVDSTSFLSAVCKWRQSSSFCYQFVTPGVVWRNSYEHFMSVSFSGLRQQMSNVQHCQYHILPTRAALFQLRLSQTILILYL